MGRNSSIIYQRKTIQKKRNKKDLKVKDDGFAELTKLLREKYAMNHRSCKENIFTFSHLLDRVQLENKSVSDFSRSLIEIAKIALPRIDVNHIDDILKDQFIFGISNERVREKCTMKPNKINDILRQQLSMKELINYAQMVENRFQKNNMTRRSYKAITNTSSDDSSSDSRQLSMRATENKTQNICSFHTKPTQKIEGTSTNQHKIRSSAPIQQTSSLKIDSGYNATTNDYVAQHAKTHPHNEFFGKRGHEMKVFHTFVRQQAEKFCKDEIDASNLNSQNQYHPLNQHQQQQNFGQGSQDQRQMQYHAAMNQKSVHFEDHMNNQPNYFQRQKNTQSYGNEGRPSTPQNFAHQ